jgi:hypothetical protein
MKGADKLQKRLRAINAEYAAIKAKRARTDSDKRAAMMQTLGAVIAHLEAQPGCGPADSALLNKLVDFLYDTENGHRTDWAIPKVSNRPLGDKANITRRRAVAAAQVTRLMPKLGRMGAAAAVRAKCAPGLLKGTKGTARTVADWRYKILSGPSNSFERQVYDAALKD